VRYPDNLILALDRARPGNDRYLLPPYFHPVNIDHRPLLFHIDSGEFERFQDGNHRLNALERSKRLDRALVLVPDDADNGAFHTFTEMCRVPLLLHKRYRLGDLFIARALLHNNDYMIIPLIVRVNSGFLSA